MTSVQSPFAPAPLELVRTFVNTRDLEMGTDVLDDAEEWGTWCDARGLPTASDEESRVLLRGLREAIRAALLANHDRLPIPQRALDAFNATLAWAAARPEFTTRGLTLQPVGAAAQQVAGEILRVTAEAVEDGTWSRLKACRNDACLWAFYDHSRSRTGQWCSMEICGNRNKQARWRDRHR